jgi:hypothetical protein
MQAELIRRQTEQRMMTQQVGLNGRSSLRVGAGGGLLSEIVYPGLSKSGLKKPSMLTPRITHGDGDKL